MPFHFSLFPGFYSRSSDGLGFGGHGFEHISVVWVHGVAWEGVGAGDQR